MGKKGGFPGGMMPGGMGNLMKQAQRMQRKLEEQQQELEEKKKALAEKEFTASAGGGAVTAQVNGKYELTKITLSKDCVDPDDIETLSDMIVASVNSALSEVKKAEEEIDNELNSGAVGNMQGLGGLGGFGL